MSLVVVGGHTRNIGKTSVAAGIIAALPQFHWTAIKITQHGHGICSAAGEPCDCAVEYDHPYAISEETAPGSSDSARFLAAGARRSFWLRTAMGQLGGAVSVVREIVESSENTILESNSILQFLRPDLYLVVVDFENPDFKDSALKYLDRADGLILVRESGADPKWTGVSRRLWEGKPRFPVHPPDYTSSCLTNFVERKLAGNKVT
jgi:hypothetical protein